METFEITSGSSVVERQPNTLMDGGSNPSPTTTRKRFYWNEPLGDEHCPYMYRTVLDFGRFGSLRMHRWLRGDETRARHDHPQDFLTLVIWGSYIDDTADGQDRLHVGSIRFRKAEHIHTVTTTGCWTLLYFWPKRREWGFWHPNRRGNGLRWFSHRSWHAWKGQVPCD